MSDQPTEPPAPEARHDPAPEAAPVLHRLSGGRKARKGAPILPILAGVLIIGAVGFLGYVQYGHKTLPRAALPTGKPSKAEAQACLRDRDFACAEADYIAYLKLYPNDAEANALLALVLTEDGRHKEALGYYKKAADLGVDTYDFHAGRARSLDATGDLDGAIAANYASLELVPSLVDVRGDLARQLVRKGQPQKAVDLLETFDRSLIDRGHPAYFPAQIQKIKAGMAAPGSARSQAASDHLAPHDAPLAGAAGLTQVALRPGPGVLYVPVLLNGAVTADFVIDSGASSVVISADVAQDLMRQGKLSRADYLGMGRAELADGSVVSAKMYNLRSLKVGGRELHNITAAVSSQRGPLLLGQSFLRRFKTWSIDNHRQVLQLQD